jgi:hypothetical protein
MALYPQEMNMPSNEDIFLTLLVMLTSWLFTSEVVRYFLALDILLRGTQNPEPSHVLPGTPNM